MRKVSFDVWGHPEPAGSKRAFAVRRKAAGGWVATGAVAVTDDNPKAKGWQALVRDDADAAMLRTFGPGYGLLEGAVGLAVVFRLRRPKGHFGTGRNAGVVKATAPLWPTKKPDTTKLLRGLEDALTGALWGDDAQVVEQGACKVYTDGREGASVTAWEK